MNRLERAMATAMLGIALWLGATWVLALGHLLTRGAVAGVAVAVAVAVALACLVIPSVERGTWVGGATGPVARASSPTRPGPSLDARDDKAGGHGLLLVVLLLLWTAFILYRGAVVPPVSHDAMTYHLPRAAAFVQAHGFVHVDSPDRRMTAFPANYELLLADVILLTGSDALTEWIGTAFYLLFLGMTAMVAQRWWGAGRHLTAAILAAGGAPLLLLHSGADKNDVMAAVFAVGALFWSARWCAEGGRAPAVLAIVCGAMGVGTKLTVGAVVLAIVPFGVVALFRRRPRPRDVAATALFAIAAFLLLGGWVFVANILAPAATRQAAAGVPTAPYGDWRNLWELPYALVRVSLGFHAPWSWPKHDLFFSHYGVLFGLAALALPFCIARYRRAAGREQTTASLAALLAFAILLPIVQLPRMFSGSIARYGVFLLPFVLAWTLVPLVRELDLRKPRYAAAVVGLIAVVFVLEALDIAAHDTFVSPEYIRWAAAHPGTRETPLTRTRAAFIADGLAGPRDTVAIFGGSDVWLYPAFGKHLTRTVRHLPYNATAADIPPAAQWVVVDYAPPLGQPPSTRELRFVDEVAADRRYRLAWRNRLLNQAVFRRVAQ